MKLYLKNINYLLFSLVILVPVSSALHPMEMEKEDRITGNKRKRSEDPENESQPTKRVAIGLSSNSTPIEDSSDLNNYFLSKFPDLKTAIDDNDHTELKQSLNKIIELSQAQDTSSDLTHYVKSLDMISIYFYLLALSIEKVSDECSQYLIYKKIPAESLVYGFNDTNSPSYIITIAALKKYNFEIAGNIFDVMIDYINTPKSNYDLLDFERTASSSSFLNNGIKNLFIYFFTQIGNENADRDEKSIISFLLDKYSIINKPIYGNPQPLMINDDSIIELATLTNDLPLVRLILSKKIFDKFNPESPISKAIVIARNNNFNDISYILNRYKKSMELEVKKLTDAHNQRVTQTTQNTRTPRVLTRIPGTNNTVRRVYRDITRIEQI